ncbi:MAG: TetR/AcrR family transcriptional regulator [Chlorobi bacterium]|nr:TetR/AcrR family transcriptional regulator [Chlorobiota bacterium]
MENKRKAIIERSWELFRKYGIKSISMDDIAREMGMSKKTLYQIVKDKNDLVAGVIEIVKEWVSRFWQVFHDDSLNAIEQHCHQREAVKELHKQFNPTFSFDLRKYYPEFYRGLNEWRRNVIMDAHVTNIEKGKKEGLYRSNINSEVIAKLIVAHHLYTFDPTNEIFETTDIVDFEVVEQFYLYHLRGLSTEKGLKELDRLFANNKKSDNA